MAVLQSKGQVMKNITNIPQTKSEKRELSVENKPEIENIESDVGGEPKEQKPVRPKKRNERERNRVKHINRTFGILKNHLPLKKAKLLSKADTLRAATDYIQQLKGLIQQHDTMMDRAVSMDRLMMSSRVQHQQQQHQHNIAVQQQQYRAAAGHYGYNHSPPNFNANSPGAVQMQCHRMQQQQQQQHQSSSVVPKPGMGQSRWTTDGAVVGRGLVRSSPVEAGIIPEWCVT